MRIVRLSAALTWIGCGLTVASLNPFAHAQAPGNQVAILRAAPWSPGDPVREGAGELEVLCQVASLQKVHCSVGLIAVGDRNGLFTHGAENALRFAALQGVPVARMAPGGEVARDPDDLFLDCGRLSESAAAAVLARCLNRHGSPPAAANPDHPTPGELAAIRKYLVPFREALEIAGAPQLTSNGQEGRARRAVSARISHGPSRSPGTACRYVHA
jgi:hypothetical protein